MTAAVWYQGGRSAVQGALALPRPVISHGPAWAAAGSPERPFSANQTSPTAGVTPSWVGRAVPAGPVRTDAAYVAVPPRFVNTPRAMPALLAAPAARTAFASAIPSGPTLTHIIVEVSKDQTMPISG